MADISDVLQQDDFKALPLPEQLKVARKFPEFAGLPPKEQGTVLYRLKAATLPDGLPPSPKDAGFLKTLGTDLKSLPGALYEAVRHPLDTRDAIEAAAGQQRDEAVKAAKEGRYPEMVGHGVASLMPVIGPAAAQAGQELGGGQPGQGAAHALELLAPFGAKPAFDALPDEVTRPVRVGAKAVKKFAQGPNPGFEGGPAAAGSRLGRLHQRLDQAYAAADRQTPNSALAAKNATRSPGRVDPQAQPASSSEPIKPPTGYVRRSPAPAAKPPRAPAARIEPTPQVKPSGEPIKPPGGKLPSGRTPGGIQNQTASPVSAPKPSPQLVQDVATGQFGKPLEKLTPSQQAAAEKIASEIRTPETPKPTTPTGRSINLPQGTPEHYGDTAQSFGEARAKAAVAKDSTIIKHLAQKGITPEQFEAANDAQRNLWLRDVNQAAGTRYEPYRGEQGTSSAARLLKLWRWAATPQK